MPEAPMSGWGPSDTIALGALAVAAISVVVAGLSLAYTRRVHRETRPESYRSALYERQLAFVEEFMAILWNARVAVMDEAPAVAAKRLVETAERLSELAIGSVFTPPEVVIAGAAWVTAVTKAVEAELNAPSDRASSTTARHRLVDQEWRRLVRRVGTEMGAHDLHHQVRELTGAAAAERRRRDRFARIRRLDLEVESMSRGRYAAPSDEELWREIDDAEG